MLSIPPSSNPVHMMYWNRKTYSPDEEDFRKIMRSKVWRSKCYLQDMRLKALGTAMLLLTVPIDCLAMRLQHLAESGSVLQRLCTFFLPFAFSMELAHSPSFFLRKSALENTGGCKHFFILIGMLCHCLQSTEKQCP